MTWVNILATGAKYSCKWRAVFFIAALSCLLSPAARGGGGRAAAPTEPESDRRLLGVRALSLLRAAMSDPESDVRALAAEAFGSIGNRGAVPLLKTALEDDDNGVQIAAAESLARLGHPAGVTALERLASEKPPKAGEKVPPAIEELRAIARGKARAAALRALLRVNGAKSEKVYRRARRNKVGVVRDAGAAALARLGDGEELEGFLLALKDPDEAVRLSAARSLGWVGTPEAARALAPAAADASADVRAAVMTSLGATEALEAAPILRRGVADKSLLVRSKALEALGRHPFPGVAAALEEEKERPGNAYLQLLAMRGLALLGKELELSVVQRSLSQKDVDARLAAVAVLEASRGDEALELLSRSLDDGDARVRVRAGAALVKRLAKAPPAPPAESADAAKGVEGDDTVPESPEEAAR